MKHIQGQVEVYKTIELDGQEMDDNDYYETRECFNENQNRKNAERAQYR